MKIIEITNTDFALRHFVLPLMRGLRARGHEVIGASADGAMLDHLRAEGFRVEILPLQRSFSLAAHWRGFWALVRFLRAEKPRTGAWPYADQRLSCPRGGAGG